MCRLPLPRSGAFAVPEVSLFGPVSGTRCSYSRHSSGRRDVSRTTARRHRGAAAPSRTRPAVRRFAPGADRARNASGHGADRRCRSVRTTAAVRCIADCLCCAPPGSRCPGSFAVQSCAGYLFLVPGSVRPALVPNCVRLPPLRSGSRPRSLIAWSRVGHSFLVLAMRSAGRGVPRAVFDCLRFAPACARPSEVSPVGPVSGACCSHVPRVRAVRRAANLVAA